MRLRDDLLIKIELTYFSNNISLKTQKTPLFNSKQGGHLHVSRVQNKICHQKGRKFNWCLHPGFYPVDTEVSVQCGTARVLSHTEIWPSSLVSPGSLARPQNEPPP